MTEIKPGTPLEVTQADRDTEFPNIAAACEHYASLPEETRAEREAEWEGK